MNVPFFELTEAERAFVLSNTSAAIFSEVETKKYKVHVRVFLSRYRGYTICPDCGGSRLRPEALYIRVGDKNLAEVVAHEYRRGAGLFSDGLRLSPEETAIAEKVLVEIQQRLKFLNDVGLEYLTLDRIVGHAFGRRSAAHSARHLPRIAAGGRLLCARRAIHRPAQPRHRPADRNPRRAARPGQHHRRGGARSRRDARRRSHCRSGSGRGRKRRAHHVRRFVMHS